MVTVIWLVHKKAAFAGQKPLVNGSLLFCKNS
jgi:hypothetical protein